MKTELLFSMGAGLRSGDPQDPRRIQYWANINGWEIKERDIKDDTDIVTILLQPVTPDVRRIEVAEIIDFLTEKGVKFASFEMKTEENSVTA